jgi:DNA repair ATPase RecN
MSNGGGGTGGSGGPTPNQHWDNLAERRLDYINSRLSEVVTQLSEVAKELRLQVRQSDQQGGTLTRLEERLRDAERELHEIPKRFDKVASLEWLQRVELRLNNIEEEGKSPFVRKTEFDPVKKVVFGLVSTLCLFVLGAVAKLIVK